MLDRVVCPEADQRQDAEEKHNRDNPEPKRSIWTRIHTSNPPVAVPEMRQEAHSENHYTSEHDADKNSMNSSVYVEKKER